MADSVAIGLPRIELHRGPYAKAKLYDKYHKCDHLDHIKH